MIKKLLLKKVFILVVALLLVVTVLQGIGQGKPPRRRPKEIPGVIQEEKRPWAGSPWLITGVLGAGAMLIGLKNAKRSQSDR